MPSIFDNKDTRTLQEKANAANSSGGFLPTLAKAIGIQKPAPVPVVQKPVAPTYGAPGTNKEAFAKEAVQYQKKSDIANSFLGQLGTVFGKTLATAVSIPASIIEHPVDAARSVLRGGISVVNSANKAMAKQGNQPYGDFAIPNNSVDKFLFGSEPIGTATDEAGGPLREGAAAAEQYFRLKPGQISESKSFHTALPIFALSAAISNFDVGGGKGGLPKELLTRGLEAKDAVAGTKLLTDMNISRDVAAKYGDLVAQADTPKKVQSIITEAAAEHSQDLKARATTRIQELDAKQKGVLEKAGVPGVEPIPLTSAELTEKAFLEKHRNDPSKLNLAYRNKVEEPVVPEPKRFDNASVRPIEDIVPGKNAEVFDRSAVEKYKRDIAEGRKIDPIDVIRNTDGKFGVEDGDHRLQAYKESGTTDIPINYREPSGKAAASEFPEPKSVKLEGEAVTVTKATEALENAGYKKEDAVRIVHSIPMEQGSVSPQSLKDAAVDFNASRSPQTTDTVPDITRDASGTVDHIATPEGRIIYDKNGTADIRHNDTGPITPKKATQYNALREKASAAFTNIREVVQDRWVKVEKAIKENGKVGIENDPYISETLYHGRLDTRIQEVQSKAKDIVFGIEKDAKALGIDGAKLTDEVNDYLIAKHAPERNAKLGEGAAGMTDTEAAAIIKKTEEGPNAAKVREYADKVQEINRETLDILYADGNPWGIISKEQYDTLKNTYKEHVPLNRIMEDTLPGDVGTIISGKGFDVRGSGIRRAKGSSREVSDILGNVLANNIQATTRLEKNLVNYDFYKYARENPDNGWVGVKKPIAIGEGFDGKPLFKDESKSPNVIQMMVDGKTTYLEFKDKNIAAAINGTNVQYMPGVTKWIGAYSRLLSNLATSLNPEFWITNKFRDVQDAMIFTSSEGRLSAKTQASKQLRLEGERAVIDHLRGKDSADAKMYAQMLEDGGTTGGLSMSTKKQVELDIEKMRETAKSKPRQVMQAVTEKLDQTNEIIENSTRFVVYKQALERGATRREAAYLAKESTVNFNRKGTAGPVINALYMFSNASIQGSTRMIKNLSNPKTLGLTVAGITTATFAVNQYNRSIDPEWQDKVSPYERSSGVTILLPGKNKDGEHNRIVIPLAYSIRPLKVGADAVYNATMGGTKQSVTENLGNVMGAVADSYNPIGGSDFISAVTPTIADLPVDIIRNKKWNGSKLAPDYNQNLPESRRYFDSLKEGQVGKFIIATAKDLSDKANIEISPAVANYVLEQLTGGAGQFSEKVANTAGAVSKGQAPSADDVPFSSKFYKETTGDAIDINGNIQDKQDISKVKGEQAKISFDREQAAKDFLAENKGNPEAMAKLSDMKISNRPLYDEVIDQIKTSAAGLTSEEKQIKSLDIKNGGRAKYIASKIDRLPKQEAANYLIELSKKKLLTKEVLQQVVALRKQ